MAYIGVKPTIGNFQICDAISVVNGQAAYTMQVGSVNVSPQSANHMIVSLNGVIQKPGSSYTVSGNTITFASNLATGDVIDFIQILGDVLDLGVPSDATISTAKIVDDAVTAAKINNDIISGSTELASEPSDTDEFLVSDNGTIKRIDYSLIKGGSLLSAQQWRISSSFSINSSSELTVTGWEKQDQSFAGSVGSDFSVSSGIFTFPTTGVFLIIYQANFGSNDYNDTNTIFKIAVSSNSGGAYTNQSQAWLGYETDGNPPSRETATCHALVNVTDASTYRAKFLVHNLDGTNAFLEGDSGYNSTNVVFIKVG